MRGLESDCGLILLTGEIGIGKTSLSRYIQSFLAEGFAFVELGNPYQTPLEQVFHCCEQFGLDTAGLSSIHDCVGVLEKHFRELQEVDKRPVIVFDESHLLTKRHLSLIHILSNLRAGDRPLVQILLVGQLEILDLLATEGMEALNQRIGVRCELSPLLLDDTNKYIDFKLEKGGTPELISFSRDAVKRIWKESGGLPRLINHVCAHTLDALAFTGSKVVSDEMVKEVCQDSVYSGLFQARTRKSSSRNWAWLAGGVAALLVVAGIGVSLLLNRGNDFAMQRTPVSTVVKTAVGTPDSPAEKPSESDVVSTASEGKAATRTAAGPTGESVPPSAVSSSARSEWTYEPDTKVVTGNATKSSAPASRTVSGEYDDTEFVVVVEEGAEASPPSEASPAGGPETGSPQPAVAVPGTAAEGPLDGESHDVVGELVLGAIAWNEVPSERIVVINSKLLREGEMLDGVKVIDIGQESVLLEYGGKMYKRVISR
ncbi:AAA family ATPase [uncultured Pseudodesulfovibrio sp.]|uniref:AAA family ATPase n=1 Tax=uncultured Pseudodesulfovibrio sp. TaxID=2035858 RepID=UPI0029C65EAD|nr:AAA family ATPase [uncultured Pseudodesulfovibrio sp.]